MTIAVVFMHYSHLLRGKYTTLREFWNSYNCRTIDTATDISQKHPTQNATPSLRPLFSGNFSSNIVFSV